MIMDYNEEPNGCRDTFIGYAIGIVLAFILCMCFHSCKTQIVTVPEIHTEFVHDTLTRVDSIYQSHTVIVKGDCEETHDTVFKWQFKEKIVESVKVDSIPYPVEVIKEVPVRNGYTRFTSWFFWIVVVLVLLWVAYKVCDKIPACKGWMTALKVFLKIV